MDKDCEWKTSQKSKTQIYPITTRKYSPSPSESEMTNLGNNQISFLAIRLIKINES